MAKFEHTQRYVPWYIVKSAEVGNETHSFQPNLILLGLRYKRRFPWKGVGAEIDAFVVLKTSWVRSVISTSE